MSEKSALLMAEKRNTIKSIHKQVEQLQREGEVSEPLDWSSTSDEDFALCLRIAGRAEPGLEEMQTDKQSIMMDIQAAHMTCPLRLHSLLEADEFNFWHDVAGIHRHLNRKTGELEDCFLPRFTQPVSATS